MFHEASHNPSFVVQPNNQAFTAVPAYTPQSSVRYVTNTNPRTLQAPSLVMTPNNNHYYTTTTSSTITTPISDRSNQQQPILVIKPHQNYINNNAVVTNNKPSELEKVRVIGQNEREFFKDGTSVLRTYKYCTCCRSTFVKKCPTWNFMVWFYSFPCWIWFLTFLVFLAFFGALIFLITQMPRKTRLLILIENARF